MDSPSGTARATQMRPTRSERGEDRGKAHSTHRSTRYKEKYQTMRERFEKVNAAKEAYQRDLQLANEKIRKIQEENDLLLDAILASPPPPTNSNPKHYQSSHPPQSMVPSQGYAQTQYQSHPPPGAVHPYRPRPDHSDHPPHNYNYSHSQTSRHQYLPYDANEGRDMAAEYESGHHYSGSIASSRSRGPPPPDVGYRG